MLLKSCFGFKQNINIKQINVENENEDETTGEERSSRETRKSDELFSEDSYQIRSPVSYRKKKMVSKRLQECKTFKYCEDMMEGRLETSPYNYGIASLFYSENKRGRKPRKFSSVSDLRDPDHMNAYKLFHELSESLDSGKPLILGKGFEDLAQKTMDEHLREEICTKECLMKIE
jgi:hypothetical protein